MRGLLHARWRGVLRMRGQGWGGICTRATGAEEGVDGNGVVFLNAESGKARGI